MKPLGKIKSKSEEEFDYLQKIIIIGDSGVGKSNLLLRYSQGKFVQNYMMTIGINYVFKVITLDTVKIKLQIWDTAGQDKYKTITQNYYRNSQGVLIVFAIDSRESFNSVRNWIQDLSQTITEATQVIIVGNKMDLKNKRSVSFEEASDAAKQYGFKYYECSAKSGDSVDEVFLTIARMMKQKIIDIAGKETVEEHIQLEVEKPVEKQRCCSS